MKFIPTIFVLILVNIIGTVYAQSESSQLKPLLISEKQKIWFDEASIDTLGTGKMNIWVLQINKPPLEIDELPGKIYSSSTLYAVDMNTGNYGILKVKYYDINNKELYNFDYKIDDYPDTLKYTYPMSSLSYMRELSSKLKR
jgi:hypothetical protein